MQQFKRVSPQRMVHQDKSQAADHEVDHDPPPPPAQRRDPPEFSSSGLHVEPEDSDEALALRLQQELDREAAEAQTVDLEDGGLFFCQICQRDLTHMTAEGRTHHLNRCLDESEVSAPAPPPPPGVPDCPICGKKFKSQKSRSTHLKRCSADMGVPPAVLLQALQRQAETPSVPAANTLAQTGGTKRKDPSKPGPPAKKKPRKKTKPVDEDTMVALALSSSLLEQERERYREMEVKTAASHVSVVPALKWRPDTGKARGKRKKGAAPRPPPLLLVQDTEAALTRLQERVSALLLRTRPPSPPSPTRSPSSLSSWSGTAPLWQKSKLLDGGSACVSDYYTPELREFITPWTPVTTDAATSSSINKPEGEGTPLTGTRASILPYSSSSPAPSTPGTGQQCPVGSQTVRDLMDLAGEAISLSQCSYTASGPDKEKSASQTTNLHLSGFVPEDSEEQADLGVSGFLPEATFAEDAHGRARRTSDRPGADKERGSHRPVVLSRLVSDLSSMVNNPQLSDLQLQVDSGDVYFAHSFMVYARCPLLAEMVHESGFGVQEEGMPAAQRVLMNDVPGQAVFALLQYLYTAQFSVPASLRPHVMELASRFDLQELQQLCERHREDAGDQGDEEDYVNQEENVNNQTGKDIMEMLDSMWMGEDEDDEGTDTDGGGGGEGRGREEDADDLLSGDGEIREEKVNEEELEEIYEFAATQRKREEEEEEEEEDSVEEQKEPVVQEEDGGEEVAKLTEHRRSSTGVKDLQTNAQLEPESSYSRLFSDSWGVYDEGEPSPLPSTSGLAKRHTPQAHPSPHKPSSEPSSRTLLQSSVSVLDDLSLSPPPTSSNMPVPGQSPGQVGEVDPPKECLPLRRDSQGPRSICVSPDSPQKKKEPELIVLSDSSEEMEVLSSRSPSPSPPCAVQSCYTQIKPHEPTPEIKKSGSLEFSPDDPPAAPPQSRPFPECDLSPADCSPEVSWLIPSTPLQSRRSTSTSSTQTKSSMRRTQLFPKTDPSSSSVFFSPALPFKNKLQTSNSPTRVSAHIGPTEGGVPGLNLEQTGTCSSSFDLNLSSVKRSSSWDVSKDGEAFAVPTSRPQDTPLHAQPRPYSSTPLLTDLHQPAVPLLATSPLGSDKQRTTSQGRERAPSESPEKMELGSFHLSPLSDPSDPPSSSSSRNHGTDGDREMESGSKDTEEEKAETGEAEAAESSFQQSFMDEPPMAFNDSWGLDACADLDANPGCFSLRLEDSKGSSQPDRSPGRRETARSSSSTELQPSPSKARRTRLSAGVRARSFTPSPPDPTTRTTPQINGSFLDSKIWDSWEEDEEQEEALPLSQRVNPSAHLKTPASSHNKRRRTLVPITPMPHYSDMDTPDLKTKLNRFGVRPLPKRQMILKLKEIHQYTHQLASSDSEDDAPPAGRAPQTKLPPADSVAAGNGLVSSARTVKFKEPRAPAAVSPLKQPREEEEDAEPLSASQGSNTSSTAASEESDRSNPELCVLSDGDSDSDGGISASQSATRLQDRLKAVRSFILSDSVLYSQILQYQPLVLSQLQQRLKEAGIRLGVAKLVDYLDSQCITFTTAKPSHSVPSRWRSKKTGKSAKAAGGKRGVTAVL